MMRGQKGASWSVDINAPQEEVFTYVQDISHLPEWEMDGTRIEGPAGPAHAGSMYPAVPMRGKRNEQTVFVSEVRPPERIEFEAQESTGLFGHEFTFEPAGGTTRVTHTIYTIVKPGIFSRGTSNKTYSGAMQKLKENVEAGRTQRWI